MKNATDYTLYMKLRVLLILLCVLTVGTIEIWAKELSDSSGGSVLEVAFLNVGQGDSIYIRDVSGNDILIDGGKDSSAVRELEKVMKKGDRDLDMVIATHSDSDHIGGIDDILSRYHVNLFAETGHDSDTQGDDILRLRVEEKEVPRILLSRGMVIDLGEATLTILSPEKDIPYQDTNTSSVIALLEYKNLHFLFTGDAPSAIEEVLLREGLLRDVDVVKLGHHGSRTSSSQNFLDAITPEYAIVSAGKDNSYGHPHAEVISRVEKSGARILNTYEGTLVFETDGETLKMTRTH